MVFDEALYKFTKNAEVEFLTTRVWIALWCVVIALAVAAFQGSVIVRYYTKFTKDIFIAFVASVFIVEALLQTAGVRLHYKFIEWKFFINFKNLFL